MINTKIIICWNDKLIFVIYYGRLTFQIEILKIYIWVVIFLIRLSNPIKIISDN